MIYLLLALAAADPPSPQPIGERDVKWFNQPKSNASPLIGIWRVDPKDVATIDSLGDVEMEFDDGGNLSYVIKGQEKHEVILMTYRVKGDLILTDQPSHPNPRQSKYVLANDGSLTVYFDGEGSRFIRR